MTRDCSTCIYKEGSCYPSLTIFDKDKTCKSYEPDYEGYIADLERKNAELKSENAELEQQIEKMKCCYNCFYDCENCNSKNKDCDKCPCGTCVKHNHWELRR